MAVQKLSQFQKFIVGKVRKLTLPPRKSIIRTKLQVSAVLGIGFQQKAFRSFELKAFFLRSPIPKWTQNKSELSLAVT
jgi:hypothetical protein